MGPARKPGKSSATPEVLPGGTKERQITLARASPGRPSPEVQLWADQGEDVP